jgi:hypothetical protein
VPPSTICYTTANIVFFIIITKSHEKNQVDARDAHDARDADDAAERGIIL